MKLKFDQNLSAKLCSLLEDVFPGSTQARLIGLENAEDLVIWQWAREHQYVIVTKDSDFADIALHRGAPPKVVWLRCGNQPTRVVELILRKNAPAIEVFFADKSLVCMEIYPLEER